MLVLCGNRVENGGSFTANIWILRATRSEDIHQLVGNDVDRHNHQLGLLSMQIIKELNLEKKNILQHMNNCNT